MIDISTNQVDLQVFTKQLHKWACTVHKTGDPLLCLSAECDCLSDSSNTAEAAGEGGGEHGETAN